MKKLPIILLLFMPTLLCAQSRFIIRPDTVKHIAKGNDSRWYHNSISNRYEFETNLTNFNFDKPILVNGSPISIDLTGATDGSLLYSMSEDVIFNPGLIFNPTGTSGPTLTLTGTSGVELNLNPGTNQTSLIEIGNGGRIRSVSDDSGISFVHENSSGDQAMMVFTNDDGIEFDVEYTPTLGGIPITFRPEVQFNDTTQFLRPIYVSGNLFNGLVTIPDPLELDTIKPKNLVNQNGEFLNILTDDEITIGVNDGSSFSDLLLQPDQLQYQPNGSPSSSTISKDSADFIMPVVSPRVKADTTESVLWHKLNMVYEAWDSVHVSSNEIINGDSINLINDQNTVLTDVIIKYNYSTAAYTSSTSDSILINTRYNTEDQKIGYITDNLLESDASSYSSAAISTGKSDGILYWIDFPSGKWSGGSGDMILFYKYNRTP